MLKRIGIENFKAFGAYTEIEIDNLTLLSGLNSAGKSTIYQSILLLQNSKDYNYIDMYGNKLPYLVLNDERISLGGVQEILHNISKRHIAFKLFFDDGSVVYYKFSLPEQNKIGFSGEDDRVFFLSDTSFVSGDGKTSYVVQSNGLDWSISANRCLHFEDFTVGDYIYKYCNKMISTENIDDISEDEKKDIEIIDYRSIDIPFREEVHFDSVKQVDLSDRVLKKFYIKCKDVKSIITDFYLSVIDFDDFVRKGVAHGVKLDDITLFGSQMDLVSAKKLSKDQISYIPPFRGMPQRLYSRDNPSPLSGFTHKKYVRIPYKYDFNKRKVLSDTMENSFKHWVVDIFNIVEDVQVYEELGGLITEIAVCMNKRWITINNVGFGVSQLIPVIYEMLIGPKGRLVIVDEPETHLHPSMQSKLADFFISMAMIGKSMLVETHSEYLIDKLIYFSIKYPEIKNLIKMHWVLSVDDNCMVKEIMYDEMGFIINSPDNFLSEKKQIVEELNIIRMERLANE